jgi:hypothetical protein
MAEALEIVEAGEMEPVAAIKHRNCFYVDLTTRMDESRMHVFERAGFPKRHVKRRFITSTQKTGSMVVILAESGGRV